MIKKLLFYISDTTDPYRNLATEQFLFESVDNETLILYLWQNERTVVIGKNQNAFLECRTELLKAEGGRLARRPSGGGAVFHDLGNLNFTFICATESFDVAKHIEVIKEACRLASVTAEISGRNDILARGRKFSGNAFYNSRGRSLHHGTLLISADMERLARYLTPPKAKLEAKGVKSARARVVNLSEISPSLTTDMMKEYLLSAFESVYALQLKPFGKIPAEEISALTEHFSNHEYIYGSPIPFNVSLSCRLSFGNAQLSLCVKDGYITDLMLYTDSLDTELPSLVKRVLVSQPFELSAIKKALLSAVSEDDAVSLVTLLSRQVF